MIKWILLSVGFIIIFLSILGIATGGNDDYIGAVITTFLVSRLYWNNYYNKVTARPQLLFWSTAP